MFIFRLAHTSLTSHVPKGGLRPKYRTLRFFQISTLLLGILVSQKHVQVTLYRPYLVSLRNFETFTFTSCLSAMKQCKREINNTQWNRHGSRDSRSIVETVNLMKKTYM